MQTSSPKPLRSLWLASAGLAPAVALLLLGTGTPRLAAQQSADFNNQSDANWTHYTFPASNGYGAAIYSFPTNPAGPAGNYAYRVQVPPILNDSNTPPSLNPRGGAMWVAPDALYGPDNPSNPNAPGFNASVDLVAWNTTWSDSVSGIGWFVQGNNFLATSAYLSGWGPGLATIGIARINISDNPPYAILGQVVEGTTVLNTNHQYRIMASSYDGATFLVQIYDRSQTNTPWQSAISQDYAIYTYGYCALLVANTGTPPPLGNNTTQGGDATFDNYYVWRPLVDQNPSQSPAKVSDTYPPPAGQATEFYPTVSASILNLETDYRAGTIQLYMDGNLITSGVTTTTGVIKPDPAGGGATINWPGVTITYSNGVLYPWGTLHTNTVVFETTQELSGNPGHYNRYTNTWTWTTAYPSLLATNALPLGSLSVRGFDVRTVQSDNGGVTLNNSLDRALQQLAIPPQIPIDRSATSIVQVLNWNKESAPPGNVPGLCQGTQTGSINIAVQSLAYLELTAGIHRFFINSDDRTGLYSGVNLADPNATAMWVNPDATANTSFDFAVEADGLYPVRCIWEETGGGAVLSLKSVNLSDNSQVLINDPGDPAGVVKAWYPIVCKSSSSMNGPYSVASTAVNVLNKSDIVGSLCSPIVVGQMVTGGTFTVPMSGSKQFYRVDAPRKTRITGFQKSGSNVVISYQVQ